MGAVLASTDSPANARGYRRLLDFARQQVPGRRCWALEGIGSYGAGLAVFLDQAGEQVVEVCRPKRAANRGGRKTDMLDAIRAAKEALARRAPYRADRPRRPAHRRPGHPGLERALRQPCLFRGPAHVRVPTPALLAECAHA
ncbi:hypothetical protein ACFT8W_14825 [Streptomyces hygroscopicus]|uniref:hypothetical protein n=1 Tax=Streptomyces hygroscopicus TaxID=1912 RepID=UPI0036419172